MYEYILNYLHTVTNPYMLLDLPTNNIMQIRHLTHIITQNIMQFTFSHSSKTQIMYLNIEVHAKQKPWLLEEHRSPKHLPKASFAKLVIDNCFESQNHNVYISYNYIVHIILISITVCPGQIQRSSDLYDLCLFCSFWRVTCMTFANSISLKYVDVWLHINLDTLEVVNLY